MSALNRKFIKTYDLSTTKRPFKYTTTVRHKGTVIAFAMDDQQRIYYSVLDLDRKEGDNQPGGKAAIDRSLDLNFWDIEPQELRFPTELRQVGYSAAQSQSIPLHRKGGGEVTDGSVLNENEIDWFMSTTARFTADAPFQVLSDGKNVYVFRQAIAQDVSARNRLVNGKAIVNNTLLLDRFVYVDGKLIQQLEVRYQRSRNKDLPASRKDALGYADLEKKPFYEPTQSLSFVRNLVGGQFNVLLVPTALPDVQRWQIFAYNGVSQRMDSFNIERSPEGLFNTRGTRYYTSSDPQRQKDVFERSPIHPATGEALVPIISQEGYAESALSFDGIGGFVTIPAAKPLDFGQQDFTIELWLQAATPASSTPECTLIEQKNGNRFPYSIRYLQSGDNAGRIRVGRSDGTAQVEFTSTARINDGAFHHIALVRSTTQKADQSQEATLTLYIDGVASGNKTDTTKNASAEGPIVLASRAGTADFSTGVIDELRMWQRGRSADELMDDRHHRLIGNEPQLAGYWRFDEASGTTLYDQTDFVNHAQLAYTKPVNFAADLQTLAAEVQQLKAATQVIYAYQFGSTATLPFEVGDQTLPQSRQTHAWFSLQTPALLQVYLEWSAMPPPKFTKEPRSIITIPGGTIWKSDKPGVIERIVVKATDPDAFAKIRQQLQAKQTLLNQRQNPVQSMWMLSQAPVGEHPGVRRSSFSISDRTMTSGCSALLYYQQEQAETGYDTTEKKPIKRNARVMLAMATAAKTGGAGDRNYIAALDFAVSREGTLAQIPDSVHLKPLKAGDSGSQNASLDAIAGLEQGIRSLKEAIVTIKSEIAELEQTRNAKDNPDRRNGMNLVYRTPNGQYLSLGMDTSSYTLTQPMISYEMTLEAWVTVTIEGQLRKSDGKVVPFNKMTESGPTQRGWSIGSAGDAIISLTITVEPNPLHTAEINWLNREIANKRALLLQTQTDLNSKQQELNRQRDALAQTVSLPMAFLHADPAGLTVLGSLLEFAWTKDSPSLFESVDGRLSLYFRGEAEQFFAAYYDVMTGRASFHLPTANAAGQSEGTLQFIARTAGAIMESTQITVTDSQSPTQASTCQVTIANPTLNIQEVWNQVPRDPQKFAAVLNGTVQSGSKDTVSYDYATHARTEPQQIGGSLHNGSRLMTVDSSQAGSTVANTQKPAQSIGGAISCRWFADSQGNALNFDGITPAIAVAPSAADFAAAGDCTLEAWINPTTVKETASVIRQAASDSNYALALRSTVLQSALEFDGIDDFIELPTNIWQLGLGGGSWASAPSAGAFTLEARVYIPENATGKYVILSSAGDALQMVIQDQEFWVSVNGEATVDDRPLQPNTWYHLACIYQPSPEGILWTYVNGVANRSGRSEVSPLAGRSKLVIGRSDSGNYFKGRIDEIRVWQGVRSADQIQANAWRRLRGTESGLVGYWYFQGAIAKDYSRRQADGALKGNPKLAASPLPGYQFLAGVGGQVQQTLESEPIPCNEWNHVAAVFNQSYALQFDGDDSVNCGSEKTLDITDSLTLEAFIQPHVINGKQYIVRKGKVGEGMPFALFLDSDKKLHFAFENEAEQYSEDKSSSQLLLDNTFYRVAVTREKRTETEPKLNDGEIFDPTKHKVKTWYDLRYFVQTVDGKTLESGSFKTDTSARSSDHECLIGESFQGAIAEVRIWNTARPQADLFSKITGKEKGLVSCWQFEENQGNIAYDSKSNNHGIRMGATWIKSPDPQGSQLLLYVNGERQLTKPPTNKLPAADPQFAIGTLKTQTGYSQNFQGQMDEIRIWKSARTEEQIQDNLFRRVMADFEHLIAYYDCDATSPLKDQSGRRFDLTILLPQPKDAFVLSTAPISNETAQVRSALTGVKTDFHDVISSTPAVQEYGDKQYDSDGNLVGVMKRCYSYIQDGKWRLITGFKVGDLEMEWIGQAQFEPQLVGFIEGAPPVPSENLTVRDASQGEIYEDVSAIELTEADRLTYTYAASKENGIDTSLSLKGGLGLKSNSEGGIGIATTFEESEVFVGVQGKFETSRGWLHEQQIGFAKGTSRLSRLTAQGNWENPNDLQDKRLGRRYVPKNVGFALVKSKTADIFALRLKHRKPEKRVTVALSMQPNPDIPEDWNIITFPINPRYTKQGTLDGRVGLSPEQKDYPTATGYSSDRSYFKPIEAYTLKNQIEKEQQQLTADYLNYSTQPMQGFKNQEEISKKLPAATQMNLFNTYVWTADGGLFAETQNTMNIKQEVIGGSSSISGMAGAFVKVSSAIAKVAVMFELDMLIGGHLNMISQRSLDSETAFGVNVSLNVERDITLKGESQAYDQDGPAKCPGKVDGYRFMTFYLKPDQEHFKDFSNKVIDRAWLDQSAEPSAAALRQAIASKNGTPWRVLHRVTYVSRVLPDIGMPSASSTEETLRAANIESNWELIKQLEPYVKSKTSSYAELKAAVEQAIDRYLPELSPAKADIVNYMSLYYQVF